MLNNYLVAFRPDNNGINAFTAKLLQSYLTQTKVNDTVNPVFSGIYLSDVEKYAQFKQFSHVYLIGYSPNSFYDFQYLSQAKIVLFNPYVAQMTNATKYLGNCKVTIAKTIRQEQPANVLSMVLAYLKQYQFSIQDVSDDSETMIDILQIVDKLEYGQVAQSEKVLATMLLKVFKVDCKFSFINHHTYVRANLNEISLPLPQALHYTYHNIHIVLTDETNGYYASRILDLNNVDVLATLSMSMKNKSVLKYCILNPTQQVVNQFNQFANQFTFQGKITGKTGYLLSDLAWNVIINSYLNKK